MSEFEILYQKFKNSGGVLQIEIHHNTISHYDIASKFLSDRRIEDVDLSFFKDSCLKLSSDEFFGIYFDVNSGRPLVRGRNTPFLNSFFFYDEEEKESCIQNDLISINSQKFQLTGPGYSYAFLDPPYTSKFGNSKLEIGQFFLDFSMFLFSDFDGIEVFQWDTSSSFFSAGREWLGSFFWTVYNPEKDWYVLITASETD